MLLLSSCGGKQQRVVEIPEPLEDSRTPEMSQHTPGSLWNSDSTSMFSDEKAKNVGDIVTILISENATASKQATTSTGRDTTMSAGIPNLFGLEASGLTDDSNLDFGNALNTNFSSNFDGTGTTTRRGTLTAALSAQVIDRYPNGNMKIRGGKEVMVNNEVQIIYLTGIIRTVDITAANTIPSTKILNARITYTGQGSLGDKQKPGWLMRTLDNVWPF